MSFNYDDTSSPNASLRCPCCNEYYNSFYYNGFTLFFCRHAMQALLDSVPVLSKSAQPFTCIYINCEISSIKDAFYSSIPR